jgi:uncharacterized peroxidase-related enzyme
MSWIDIIAETEAQGRLKEIYSEISKRRGKVANILKVHSLNPRAMRAHFDLYISIMFKEVGLTREEREILATTVSTLNGCQYCMLHHGEALLHYWNDEKKLNGFIKNIESFDLPEKARTIVNYAIKLTKMPEKTVKADIEPLRKVGLKDDQILNLNLIISYFNFVNRIANGLGVEFSEEEIKGYKY